jgi:hypothetical protein
MSDSTITKLSDNNIDSQFLARAGLTGAMGGLGIGGLLSLAYMISEAIRDKSRADKKRKEVEELSPYLPTTGLVTVKTSNDDDEESVGILDSITGAFSEAGHGMWMYPTAAAAVGIPAWLTYKFLKNRFDSSRTSQLERELATAREEFREALRGSSKLANDIDSVIDEFKAIKQATIKASKDPYTFQQIDPKAGTDEPPETGWETLGGIPGAVGGTISVAGLASAYLIYKLLDSRYAKSNPKTQAIRAMKSLQKRRKSLSEITPAVRIKRDPEGRLYPSI